MAHRTIRNRSQLWLPVLGSLSVYLVPLIGPHTVWFLGEWLFRKATRASARKPSWLAADLATAVTAQVALGLMFAWSLRKSRLRRLIWIPAIPMLIAALNMAMLVAIPSYFLIEPDTAPEISGWEEHCFVPDLSLMPVRTSVNQPAAGAREWWVQRPDARYALLRLPNCAVVDARLPHPTVQPGGRVDLMLGVHFVAPGGATTLEQVVPSPSRRSWWLMTDPSAPITPIDLPDLAEGAPILSDTADAVVWLQRGSGSAPAVRQRVIVQALQPSSGFDRFDIDLAPFGPASFTLLGVDTAAREAVLWRNDEPLVVGFDGLRRSTSFAPGSIRPHASTYLRHRSGWVAWDAYRDTGPYQLSWSLTDGSGTRRTNRGRSITSTAVDPSGRFVALSESTTLNIGAADDVVSVTRTADGAEVFRVYLPRFARTQVVFFEGGFFGYSDLTGTHVLKIPQ